MMRPRNIVAASALVGAVLALVMQSGIGTAAAVSADCVTDCDGDRHVTIDELVRCIDAALDQPQLTACPACDQDDDGNVGIDELVRGILVALGVSLSVNGTCMVPGPTGLEPCAPETHVRAALCDDGRTCFDDGGAQVLDLFCVGVGDPSKCVGPDGKYVLQGNDCRALGAALVLSADVNPDPEQVSVYRALSFGAVDDQEDVMISPMSEAAVAIIADIGLATLTPDLTAPLVDAVVVADSRIDYRNLDFGVATTVSRETAEADTCVQCRIIEFGPILVGTAVAQGARCCPFVL